MSMHVTMCGVPVHVYIVHTYRYTNIYQSKTPIANQFFQLNHLHYVRNSAINRLYEIRHVFYIRAKV